MGSFFAPRGTIVLGCISVSCWLRKRRIYFRELGVHGSPTSHCKAVDLEGRCWKLFACQPFRSFGNGEFSVARSCPGSCQSEQKGYEFFHFDTAVGSVLPRFQVELCHFKTAVLAIRPPKTKKMGA